MIGKVDVCDAFCRLAARRHERARRRAHGSVGELMEADGGDADETIAKFAKAGIDCDKLATDLQREAAGSFVKDWNEMLTSIASKISGFKALG